MKYLIPTWIKKKKITYTINGDIYFWTSLKDNLNQNLKNISINNGIYFINKNLNVPLVIILEPCKLCRIEEIKENHNEKKSWKYIFRLKWKKENAICNDNMEGTNEEIKNCLLWLYHFEY